MDKDNVFVKILNGEIPSYTIYEDEDFKVILDRFPSSLGHSLIIPKTPCENIFDLPEDVARKVMPLAARIARALKSALNCDGVNVLQNNGTAAGQSVFYFHVHVIPRYADDTLRMGWDTVDPAAADFERIAETVASDLR